MTLPTIGAISAQSILSEYQKSGNSFPLNAYYAGGANVPAGSMGKLGLPLPTSGMISYDQFHSASWPSLFNGSGFLTTAHAPSCTTASNPATDGSTIMYIGSNGTYSWTFVSSDGGVTFTTAGVAQSGVLTSGTLSYAQGRWIRVVVATASITVYVSYDTGASWSLAKTFTPAIGNTMVYRSFSYANGLWRIRYYEYHVGMSQLATSPCTCSNTTWGTNKDGTSGDLTTWSMATYPYLINMVTGSWSVYGYWICGGCSTSGSPIEAMSVVNGAIGTVADGATMFSQDGYTNYQNTIMPLKVGVPMPFKGSTKVFWDQPNNRFLGFVSGVYNYTTGWTAVAGITVLTSTDGITWTLTREVLATTIASQTGNFSSGTYIFFKPSATTGDGLLMMFNAPSAVLSRLLGYSTDLGNTWQSVAASNTPIAGTFKDAIVTDRALFFTGTTYKGTILL